MSQLPPVVVREDGEPVRVPVPAYGDADLLASLRGAADESDLSFLSSIDPTTLSDPGDRVAYLQAVDRVAAFVAALRSDAVVAFAGAEPAGAYLPEVHVEQELSVAARTSRYSAGRQIETARALATVFPAFKTALREGRVTAAHCTILVDRTRLITDPGILAALARVALPKAQRMTPGQFATECAALVARFDPDATDRHRRARTQRRVSTRELGDGLGFLALVHDWTTITAIERTVRADGRALQLSRRAAEPAATGSEEDLEADTGTDTSADGCRADALAARLLGLTGDDGTITWEPAPAVEVQVVIDLATLRGEAENPCLLDGTPVPAGIARDLAAHATWWRRLVTDPVTGHLLDYGTRTYLPAPLRTYVLARDGGCSTPGCTTRAATRMQLDHATPYPHGPSNPTNTHGRCTTCHQLKTAGHATITNTHADGSHTWTSTWGQTVHIPARPLLPGRDDPPPTAPAPPPPAEEPPPF